MKLAPHASLVERLFYWGTLIFTGLVLLFLISPILAIVPLSFNSEPYFSYPMPGLSLQWYTGEWGFLTNERWTSSLKTSIIVAVSSTIFQILIASLAAYAFARMEFWGKNLLTGLDVIYWQTDFISPTTNDFATAIPARNLQGTAWRFNFYTQFNF